jgi:hypothetical protein
MMLLAKTDTTEVTRSKACNFISELASRDAVKPLSAVLVLV